MSLELTMGTEPHGLLVSQWPLDAERVVTVGDYRISMDDFCEVVMYVLMNSDLGKDDPRLPLVERVKKLRRVEGWNPGGERLAPGPALVRERTNHGRI